LTSSNTFLTINNDRNVNKCQFLLSLTQLSIWSNNFFGKGFAPTIWFEVHNSHMQCDFPCNICAKNEFYKGCSNNNFNYEAKVAPKVRNSHNKDPIVKFELFGHNSLKHCAYLSSPWPCVIIHVRVMGNCPRPDIILLHTYNLGNAVFAWSILSWTLVEISQNVTTARKWPFQQNNYMCSLHCECFISKEKNQRLIISALMWWSMLSNFTSKTKKKFKVMLFLCNKVCLK
jgi:hypothetical protein